MSFELSPHRSLHFQLKKGSLLTLKVKAIGNDQNLCHIDFMKEAEIHFNHVASQISDAVKGQLFGKPCYKIGSKAFCCFFHDEMVFKLEGEAHNDCLSLDGAQLFDPSGKGRPMKAWVQIPFDYQEKWEEFANAAAQFVGGL